VAKLLAMMNKGKLGTWSRIELDSGEVVFVSLALEGVRVSSMKKRFGFWVPDKVLYEVPTADAHGMFSRRPLEPNHPVFDTLQEQTGEFLGWLSGIVAAVPDTTVMKVALPVLIGDEKL
jgi:hypothetical protein